MRPFFSPTVLLFFLALKGPVPGFGVLQSPCTWVERALVTPEVPDPPCEAKCFTLCNQYPSEYMCMGYQIFLDDFDKRIDQSSPNL